MSYNINNYNPYQHTQAESTAVQGRVAQAMKAVYLKMTIALAITGVLSYFLGYSPDPRQLSTYNEFLFTHSWMMWALFIGALAIVWVVSSRISRMNSATGSALFYTLAVIYALTLTPIFAVYTTTSIAKTFFITAGTFGAMSVYGYTTSTDLTKFGNILFMLLIGLIIASLVNIFTHSSTLGWIISVAGVLIFVGLTAWDTQQIKNMAMMIPASETGRLATMGALSLYLDFINLFIYLLRFFGSSRD